MTHTTPRLERAMRAAHVALFGDDEGYSSGRYYPFFCQAFMADLLLPDPPAPVDPDAGVITIGASFDCGFAAYEHMIKVRAGLVKESDDDTN